MLAGQTRSRAVSDAGPRGLGDRARVRSASHAAGRRAGWTSCERPAAVDRRRARAPSGVVGRRPRPDVAGPPSAATWRAHTTSAAVVGARGTCRATAGRRGPGAPARRPAARVQPAVLAAQRPRQRRALARLGLGGELAAQPRAERPAEQVGAPGRQARLELRRRLGRRRAAQRRRPTIGPVSRPASMRIASRRSRASPARIVAGIGDAPRCRGSSDGWRFSAPCGRSRSAAGTIWP